MKLTPAHSLMISACAIIALIIGYAVWNTNKPGEHDALAQCLTEKGVKMYGAWWCPHCQNQKREFGSSFSKVNYIECSQNRAQTFNNPECTAAGVGTKVGDNTIGVPLWVLGDGTKLFGEQTLQTLADKSGCQPIL